MTVDVETREREALRTDPVRLLALAAATAIVLVLALQRGHVDSFVAWFFAVPALFVIVAAIHCLPENFNSRLTPLTGWVRGLDFLWYVALGAFAVSFAVAQIAMSIPSYYSYWPAFALWLGAILLTLFAIVKPMVAPLLDWPLVRAWVIAHKWELLFVAGVTLAAFILRVVNLSSEPTPYSGDEAAIANGSEHVLKGETRNMFISALQGHATLQYFAQAAFFKFFGVSVFSSRLIAAVAGTVTIPLFYLFMRQMFGSVIAALGAVYLTGYHFAVHFSRVSMENIADPLLMVAALYFVWRATRSGRWRDFALAGLVMGLGLYLSPAGRVVPVVAAAVIGYAVLRRPSFIKRAIPGSGLMALTYGVAAFPLAVFWLTHQNEFMDRINAVGIFQSGWVDEQRKMTGDSTISLLWQQARHAFGAFGYYEDTSPHYFAPIALVDRLSLVPFLVGLGYSIYRFLDDRYMLLLMMFTAVVVTGGVLTRDPPTTQRLLGTVPAVAAFVAIGVKLIADNVSTPRPQTGIVVAGVAMAALFTANVHFYFDTYRDGGYYSDQNTRVGEQVAKYAKTLPEETRIFFYGANRMFLSGGGHPAMTWPLWDRPRYDVLEDGRVVSNPFVPLEGEAPAVFIFLPHRDAELPPVVAQCPGGELVTYSTPAGRAGISGMQSAQKSFTAYEVLTPSSCLPPTTYQPIGY